MKQIPRLYGPLLAEQLAENRQMAFLSGPRQVGKTTSSKSLEEQFPDLTYLDWDDELSRRLILEGQQAVAHALGLEQLRENRPLCIFDELHKYAEWKNFLKGFFDRYEQRTRILVTGRARLDVYRKGGDSLMGRYFAYRMHPLSLGELVEPAMPTGWFRKPSDVGEGQLHRLLQHGGFPEPFCRVDAQFTRRWRRTRTDLLFREELRDGSNLQDMARVRLLASLLAERAGQVSSFSSYAWEIRVANDTVRRWTEVLEAFYYCFAVKPWHKNLGRALRKEPKFYLWDWSEVHNAGARFENLVACALLKTAHAWTDLGRADVGLYFIRDKEKREVDFLLVRDGEPWLLVEAKSSAQQGLSPALMHYHKVLGTKHALQVVQNLSYVDADCFMENTAMLVPAQTFLTQLV